MEGKSAVSKASVPRKVPPAKAKSPEDVKRVRQAAAQHAREARTEKRKSLAVAIAADESIDPYQGLPERQRRFVDEYLISLNGTDAYKKAGFSVKSDKVAGVNACKLLADPRIARAIDIRKKARQERTEISQDVVLKHLMGVAFGDANELVEFRRRCCRYCWGMGYRYQYTPAEFESVLVAHQRACREAEKEDKPLPPEPDERGGVNFDGRKAPNPDCPECFGEGRGYVFVHDTGNLPPEALALYAGVKEGKEGIEVKTKSSDKAIEMLAKHVNFYEEKVQVNVTTATPQELDAIYKKRMEETAKQAASVAHRSTRPKTED